MCRLDDMTTDRPPKESTRFSEPFGSLLWHADGTPFTPEEYIEAGFDPPTQEQIDGWAQQEAQLAEGNT